MALGLGHVGVVVALAAAGCVPATHPVRGAQDSRPVALEARVEADAVRVGDASYQGEELVTQLRKGRGGGLLLGVRVAADATDQALAEVLAAAPNAGFDEVRLERSGESLTITTSHSLVGDQVTVWRSGEHLVGYDLTLPPGQGRVLGPLNVATEQARAGLRKALMDCEAPCRAQLDLLPENPPRMWQTLSAWQQVAASVPLLSPRVLAVSFRTPPGVPPPKAGAEAPAVSGFLPPQIIQHIVRSNFGRFRPCYEAGLGRNPNLSGHIDLRFVIERSGKVSEVSDAGSDISDAEVVSCALKVVSTFEFPPPALGVVTVVYPIMFAPGD